MRAQGIDVRATDTWLDLGCHNGTFLNLIGERFGVRGTGIDVYDPSLKGNEPWRYVQGRLPDFSFPEPFDFISALEVLEHMVDTDTFLENCRRALKPGGFLFITTPNINSLRNRIMTFFGVYPTGLEYRTVIHHVRLYNQKHLRSHLAEHGFQVVGLFGVSFLPVKLLQVPFFRALSEMLADILPQLCGNFIVIAKPSVEAGFFVARPRTGI